MNIAVVDDLPSELSRISRLIGEYASENHRTIDLKTFQNAEEFLKEYRPLQFTLVFMDIYMGEISGVDAAKKMRKADPDTFIIFLTTSADHAFDAFDVHAYQYILKSPDDGVLKKALYRVLDEITAKRSTSEGSLIISEEGEEISLAFSDIVYAQSNRNYIQIVDRNDISHRVRMTFSQLQDTLNADNRFLTINRGIIINMDHITSFEKGNCVLKDIYNMPIKLKDHKRLDQIRKNYVFSKLHNKRETGGNI